MAFWFVVESVTSLPFLSMVGATIGPQAIIVAVAVLFDAPVVETVTVRVAVKSDGDCEECVTVVLVPEVGAYDK